MFYPNNIWYGDGIYVCSLFIKNLPSLEQLENYDPDLVTRIYSSDGKVLNELFVQKRSLLN